MKRNFCIDFIRLIGAFLIMCLHASFGHLNVELVDNLRLLGRWAVPFFFIATGFFLGNKIDGERFDLKKVEKNIATLIGILIVSNIVYFVCDILKHDTKISVGTLLTGTFFHLWFIGSLILGYIVIWYLYFIGRKSLLPFITISIIVLALFTDSYDQLLGKNIPYFFVRFLLSIPFMYIGIFINKSNLNKLNIKLLSFLVLCGVALQMGEAQYFKAFYNYSKTLHQFLIGTILIAIPLFIFSAKIDMNENVFSRWGRDYSLFIYIYHPFLYFLMELFLPKLIPNYAGSLEMITPVIGFAIILSGAVILNKYLPRVFRILNGDLSTNTLKSI